MKLHLIFLLSLVCLSSSKITDEDIERKLEVVLRELEFLKRTDGSISEHADTKKGEMIRELKRLINERADEHMVAKKEYTLPSQMTNERRGTTPKTGICYDPDALARANTEVLHRERNDGNSGTDGSGRRKRQTSPCYEERTCTSTDQTTRSADGSCNNLANPNWGKAGTPMTRFLSNKYQDGISAARTEGVDGGVLPGARLVSTTIHRDDTVGDFDVDTLTHLTMQWGQFLAHDYASTPTQTDDSQVSPVCCFEDLPEASANCSSQESLNENSMCLPIIIPDDDPHFTTRKCMQFVRSVQAEPLDCQAEHKEQLNAISTFIDASNVYGSTDDYMKSLRTETEGKLRTSENDLLPHDVDGLNCVKDTADDVCFKAGDFRVNVQPGLASLHTLFVRLHNIIASFLSQNNPTWDDEKIFQASRKIIGALMQHITYNEWLPVILGDKIDDYDLKPTTTGFDTVYDAAIDPRITTEFATAAGRFGHSMIQSAMSRKLDAFSESTPMSSLYGRAKYVTEENGDGLNRLINGLVSDTPEKADDWYSTEVRDRLFENGDQNALDLAALNIQRGRDHGIPTYNDMREFCGLPRAAAFNDSEGGFLHHRNRIVRGMQRIFNSPDDVDLYSAGVSENPVDGGQVGPLFACLNGKQFEALKKGDRFWYENEFADSGFTIDQLNSIKKVRFARVICDTAKIDVIPQDAFRQIRRNNPEASCDDEELLPKLDLTPWIEAP